MFPVEQRRDHVPLCTPETIGGQLQQWLRRLCFGALVVLSAAAAFGTVWFYQLWWATAQACERIYIRQTDQSLLFNATAGTVSLWDRLISLDISSASALVLTLVSLRVASKGLWNALYCRFRDGPAFWSNGYTHPGFQLVPPSLRAIFVQLGLLGTLLSFILAANLQMQRINAAARSASASTGQDLVRKAVEADVANGQTDLQPRQAANTTASAEGLSDAIFVLLCASLYSSLVGCFVAYLIVPPLNWLNETALGARQVPDDEDEILMQNFAQGLRVATSACFELKSAVAEMTEDAGEIGSLSDCLNRVEQALNTTAGKVNALGTSCTKLVGEVNEGAKQVSKAGSAMTELGNQVLPLANDLQRFVPEFTETLGKFQKAAAATAATIQHAADQAADAAGQSASAARHVVEAAVMIGNSQAQTVDVLGALQQSVEMLHRDQAALAKQRAADELHLSKQLAELKEQLNGQQKQLQEMKAALKGIGPIAPKQGRRGLFGWWRGERSKPLAPDRNGQPHTKS